MNKQGGFFQFLQHCSKIIILDTLKWNLMDLQKGLDDTILAPAWHVGDIDSRVFQKIWRSLLDTSTLPFSRLGYG